MNRVAWVPEDANARGVRHGLLEEIEVLDPHLEPLMRPSRHVATRAREAGDEAALHRIRDTADDNGDGPGGALGRHGRRRGARCEDHVDLQPDELGRELGQPLVLPLGGADLEDDALTLDPAEISEAVPEGLVERRARG